MYITFVLVLLACMALPSFQRHFEIAQKYGDVDVTWHCVLVLKNPSDPEPMKKPVFETEIEDRQFEILNQCYPHPKATFRSCLKKLKKKAKKDPDLLSPSQTVLSSQELIHKWKLVEQYHYDSDIKLVEKCFRFGQMKPLPECKGISWDKRGTIHLPNRIRSERLQREWEEWEKRRDARIN